MQNTKEIKMCILTQLPNKWQKILENEEFENLEEIRFRIFLPVMLYFRDGNKKILDFKPDRKDMEALLCALCKNSVYAYRESIAKGFVTLSGGHRAGLSGRAVMQGGEVVNLTEISGINIRLARHVTDCARSVMPHIVSAEKIKNTIIVSPPAAGKTTMLRSIAKELSRNFKVCVIDERSELAGASHEGFFDLGLQTDVIDCIPKAVGITMALRSLSPEVIITDEIDTDEDIGAVKNILGAGTKIITSTHSDDFEALKRKKEDFFKLFDLAVLLSRRCGAGTIEEVCSIDDIYS